MSDGWSKFGLNEKAAFGFNDVESQWIDYLKKYEIEGQPSDEEIILYLMMTLKDLETHSLRGLEKDKNCELEEISQELRLVVVLGVKTFAMIAHNLTVHNSLNGVEEDKLEEMTERLIKNPIQKETNNLAYMYNSMKRLYEEGWEKRVT